MPRKRYFLLLTILMSLTSWIAMGWRAATVQAIGGALLVQVSTIGTATVATVQATNPPSQEITATSAAILPKRSIEGSTSRPTLHFFDHDGMPTAAFTLTVEGLRAAPAGSHYELWLQGDGGALQDMGAVVLDKAAPVYAGIAEEGLLAAYETALLSVESEEDASAPTSVIYSGTIPSALLTPLRELLFGQQYVGTSAMTGTVTQAQIANETSASLAEALDKGKFAEVRRQAEEMVNLIEGIAGDRSGDLDRDGIPSNPGDGHGLLVYIDDVIVQINLLPPQAEYSALQEQILAKAADAQRAASEADDQAFGLIGANQSVEAQMVEKAQALFEKTLETRAETQALYALVLQLADISLLEVGPLPVVEKSAVKSTLATREPVTESVPAGETSVVSSSTPVTDETAAATDEDLPVVSLDEDIPVVHLGPLPDLAIAQLVITTNKNECGSGADLGMQVLIINKGESVAPEFIIQINSDRLKVEAGLEPEQSVRIWRPDYGDRNKVTLDPGGLVDESSEDNNTMSIGSEATVIPTCEPTATDTPTPTWTPTPTPTDTPTPSSTPVPQQPPTPTFTPTPLPPAAPVGGAPLQFAFVRGNIGNTDIYVYDIATGSVKAVAAHATCDEAELRWAPSGASILYHANCNGSYDIFAVDVASGAIERLTATDQYDEWEPNLSSDKMLLYRRTQAKPARDTADAPIYLQALSTGEVNSFGLSGRSPIISPDGTKIVYMSAVSGAWQIYVYDVNSAQTQLISTNCPAQCRWPTWLPDSTAVSYTSSTADFTPTGIWVAPLGEQPWEWLHGDVGRASWSDSGQVVFDTAAGIEVSDFQGNNRYVAVQDTSNWAPYWNH